MSDPCPAPRTDLAGGTSVFLIWWLPTAILAATAFSNGPLSTVLWPVLLTWMGGACLLNARRCGRRHCLVTGPFFLALAIVSLLYGLHVLDLGPKGWRFLAIALLVGSCVLTCLPEWIWGKYMISERSQSSQEERP
jgi:hypothetical protein